MYEFTVGDMIVAGIAILIIFGLAWTWIFEGEIPEPQLDPTIRYTIGTDCSISTLSLREAVIQVDKLSMAARLKPGQLVELAASCGDSIFVGYVTEVNGYTVTIEG